MKKRIISILVVITAVFSGGSLAAPDTEDEIVEAVVEEQQETYQKKEYKNGQFDTSEYKIMEISEEEKQQKEAEILARMEQEREVRKQQFEAAMREGILNNAPNMLQTYSSDIGMFYPEPPFFDAIGGYTILNGERLTIDMSYEDFLQPYVDEVTYRIDDCRGNYDSLYATYIRKDSSTQEVSTSSFQIYHPYNISGVYLQSISYPDSSLVQVQGGIQALERGWHKISLHYIVYEYEFNSFEEYYTYDLYVPVDVFVMGSDDYYRDLWEVDGHVQDWFGNWLIEAIGEYEVRPINDYQEIDLCDLQLSRYSIDQLYHQYGKTFQNTDQSPNKIPDIIGCLSGSHVHIPLNNTNIYGYLPESIAEIETNELEIDLSNNHLTGHIPSRWKYIALHTNCLEIYLSNNRLTGTIPALLSTGQYPWLFLENNQFTEIEVPTDSRAKLELFKIAHNFISAENIEEVITAYDDMGVEVQCYGADEQYKLELQEAGRSIDILPGMTVTDDFLKNNYTQITLNGEIQSWDVASELVFGIETNTDFSTIFRATTTGYVPIKTGLTAIWMGFTQDQEGATVQKSEMIGIPNVTIMVFMETFNDIVRKNVTEGEIVQVVVSGKSLQNILTKTFAISYFERDLELIDAYAPTPLQDLSVGLVPGSNMNITEIIPGSLKFKITPSMGTYTYWGGVAAILKFRAKRTIATAITLG